MFNLLAINAFIMSHVLILKSLEKIFIWYEERIVRWIKHYGILSSLSSLVAITVYTYLGLQNHQSRLMVNYFESKFVSNFNFHYS